MLSSHTVFSISIFALIMSSYSALADSPIPYRPPNEPRKGDPDLSSVSDERLRRIYTETINGIRSAEIPIDQGGYRMDFDTQQRFISQPKIKEDIDYVIQAAHDALGATPPDWSSYRVVLWAAKAGMQEDSRLVELCRAALQKERSEKLSNEHAYALIDSLRTLGHNNSPEAIELLFNCTTEEFWGDQPLRTPILNVNTSTSIRLLRTGAVTAISFSHASLSLPVLEQLADLYPESGRVSFRGDYTFEESIGFPIRQHIWEVKKRDGLPHDVKSPLTLLREKIMGMTFEEMREKLQLKALERVP